MAWATASHYNSLHFAGCRQFGDRSAQADAHWTEIKHESASFPEPDMRTFFHRKRARAGRAKVGYRASHAQVTDITKGGAVDKDERDKAAFN